jgi:glyoxylase I family protein
MLSGMHHVALICSDYARSKAFYSETLGLQILAEHYREARDSWKLDLQLPDGTQLELFSFPGAPERPSRPEAQGLRHLSFVVDDVAATVVWLNSRGVTTEPVRIDPYTGAAFTFFQDPDGLPLEIYQRL